MQHSQLLENIAAGQISSIYLLYGEETFLTSQLEHAIINQILQPEDRESNLIILDTDPKPQDLVTLVEAVPFIGEKIIVVIHNTLLFRAQRQDKDTGHDAGQTDATLLKIFGNMPETACLILTTPEKVDKRRKLYKVIEKHGVIFEATPFKPWDSKGIGTWIRSRLKEMNARMSSDALEYLLMLVGNMSRVSLDFLNSELEKTVLYTDNKPISLRDLERILAAIPELSVFAMTEAVGQKQVSKALELMTKQLEAGEHPIKLIGLLAREIRVLWQIKEMIFQGYSVQRIASSLGLSPYIAEKKMKQSQRFTVNNLQRTLLSLAQADIDFKSGRTDRTILEQIIIELCR
ncbi:hypothetical protein P22_0197 [Propionispora sp. 2/2-37]|uniref:DNA polymerase III subunit delta n=1 Tax=Propionispora sp. 2/2-37 TaxID=1677858 RepID=UPI0006BB5571|nr:DNA polymerase III subunit delta [Propionispora sp. 2/2-37]CUH94135.1 hypothetical protein P22_0197 [Propionispora sp. 2/2-37]